MSIILNALRKSEQERQTIPAETLENKILVKQDPVKKNKPGWLVALIVINSILLAFFLWRFMQIEEKDVNEKPVVGIKKTEIKAVKRIEKKSIPKIETKLTPPQITIAQQIKKAQAKKNENLKQQAPLKTAAVTLPVKKVVEQINIQKEENTQKPATVVVANKKNDPPFLSEMSYEFRRSVPDININVFVYSEQPQDRFIMVNMQKYRVGDEIDQEIELQEIRSNSIVVEYNGKVFQIQR